MEFAKPELELFQKQHYQSQIDRWVTREYTPISSIQPGSPIEFVIAPVEGHMPDLSRSSLYVRAKVVQATGENLGANADVSVANMPIHSIWSSVEVRIGDTLVSDSNNMYPYRAIMETLLSYTTEALLSQKQSALFTKDTAGAFSATKITTDTATNIGMNARGKYFAASAEVELMDRIHADLFYPDLLLPTGLTIRVRLIPASSGFPIIRDAVEAKVVVTDARIFVPFKQPSDAQLVALEHAIVRQPVRIPLRRVALKHLTIPGGLSSSTHDNIIMGRLPKRIILGLVTEAAMSGNSKTNPFNFEHFNLNYLALNVNGELVPSRPYQPDFGNKRYIREYLGLIEAMDITNKSRGIAINRDDYGSGYTLFGFDLSADQSPNADSYDARRTGSVRLEIKFAAALAAAINVIILAEYPTEILIDKYRNIVSEF